VSKFIITANKAEILDKLRKNRETHAAEAAEAREGFKKKAAAELHKRARLIAKGKSHDVFFNLPYPQDYTEKYDSTIRMLELHQSETIALDESQYQQYVEDNWSWTGHYVGSNAMYSASVAAKIRSLTPSDD
jgi:hypothetical protein